LRRKANFTFAQVCLNLGSFIKILNSRKALNLKERNLNKKGRQSREKSAGRLNLQASGTKQGSGWLKFNQKYEIKSGVNLSANADRAAWI
jgi:hypothetical protein